jgi:phytoene/squalene synthetase
MAQNAPVEIDHCRELALQPGSLFEFTSRYLQADLSVPILVVYALKQAVCTIPYAPVDDVVKWEKLKWWSNELMADPDSPSRHPVVRALKLSGARAKLDNSLLLRLVGDALMQIDVVPDTDESAMFDGFSEWGAAEIQLELALENAEIDNRNLGFLAAASRLAVLISSFAPNQRTQFERVPLNVLAKFNISSTELKRDSGSDELVKIVSQLVELCLDWFSEGLSDLNLSAGKSTNGILGSHLQLCWALEKRRLSFISKDVNGFLGSGRQIGPTDAWFAWRFLRNLK